jgi:hypothetical protein
VRIPSRHRISACLAAVAVLGALASSRMPRTVSAQTGATVYSDALASGWQSWSWDTTLNLAATNPVQAGTRSMAATYSAAWAGLYLHTATNLSGTSYDTLRFWIHGGSSATRLELKLADAALGFGPSVAVNAVAGSWRQVDVSVASLGAPAAISGLVWQDASGAAQPTFYLDEVQLLNSGATPLPTTPPGTGPALSVNAGSIVRPINPDIYGMNFADEALASNLGLPVRRWGGNATTRFNWRLDTSNRAMDWYFENIPEDNPNPSGLPDGSSTDRFVEQDRRTGGKTILTMPLIGWTPKARAYACGFSVALYGAQQSTDPWRPDCGNGIRTNGSKITGNNPTDTSVAIDPQFVRDWIAHLTARYGTASAGGVAYYNLDNEPMLWNDTHRDVHPQPLSYDELRDRTYQYAAAIKAADPSARTLGPAEWGWTGYFYSALDAAPGGSWWNNPQDRNAHGGTALTAWYLQEMRRYEVEHGVRVLDYLDLHYYPQASGVSLSGAGSATTQALRLRSTRGLWDTSYVDESWIDEPVYLIPRMRAWVDANYPGTKLAITEYNWGGLEHINGALAQADVLGIFGREGLDLATHWSPPSSDQPGAFAFRVYRNYDGNGGRFGDQSVAATSADQAVLAVYGARRSSDGALTLVVVNKSDTARTSSLALSGFAPAAVAQVWRYSAANLSAIVRQPDQAVTGSGFSATYPAQSITLLVVPASGTPPTATVAATSTTTATATPVSSSTPTVPPTVTTTATPVLLPYLHVGGLTGQGSLTSSSRWKAVVTVTVHGANHAPQAGVTVNAKWTNGAKGNGSCLTGNNGVCQIEKTGLSTRTDSVTLSVTGLTRSGYSYRAADNDVGGSVTVARP